MFKQLLNLLERYYVYLHLCLLVLSSHKIVYIVSVWWYQRLYSTILASWRWALVLETCRDV